MSRLFFPPLSREHMQGLDGFFRKPPVGSYQSLSEFFSPVFQTGGHVFWGPTFMLPSALFQQPTVRSRL